MSRVDHIVSRQRGDDRKPRVIYENAGPGRRRALVEEQADGTVKPKTTSARHRQGDGWWKVHYADLVERRVVTDREWGHSEVTYQPRPRRPIAARHTLPERPPMTARPEGMTRQRHRQLYRQLCKRLGIPWRKTD